MRALRLGSALALLGLSTSAEVTYRYTFGTSALASPKDVAVYAPRGRKDYVFVTDQGTNELVRFRFDGNNALVPKRFAAAFLDGRVWGVAVNDIPGHCNQGQVYVVESVGFPATSWVIHVFGVDGSLKMDVGTDLTWLVGEAGIDCDARGDVYVTAGTSPFSSSRVIRLAASHFDPSRYGASWIVTPDDEFIVPTSTGIDYNPVDVSVDLNYRVYAAHHLGDVARFEPDTTLEPVFSVGTVDGNIRGVDATDPVNHMWFTQGAARRFTYTGSVPAQDLVIGTTQLGQPLGIESEKFLVLQLSGINLLTRSEERVFVVDGAAGEIDVFGEDTTSTQIPNQAVAWWRMREVHDACDGALQVVNDAIGANDGFVTGAFPPPVTCKSAVGDGLRFDTPGNAVQVPDAPSLDFGTGNFTIEGWLRMREPAGLYTVLDKRVGTGAGYSVYVWQGQLGLQLNGGTAFQNWTNVNGAVADGAWHHFAFSVQRGAAVITGYVDGVATAGTLNANLAGLSLDTTADLLIGAHNSDPAHFEGGLDELTLYSRALSAAEIDAIWQARYAGKHSPPLIWDPPPHAYVGF